MTALKVRSIRSGPEAKIFVNLDILFAGLHTFEEAHVQVILCRNFGEQGLGLAIRDRLLKAAGGRICK